EPASGATGNPRGGEADGQVQTARRPHRRRGARSGGEVGGRDPHPRRGEREAAARPRDRRRTRQAPEERRAGRALDQEGRHGDLRKVRGHRRPRRRRRVQDPEGERGPGARRRLTPPERDPPARSGPSTIHPALAEPRRSGGPRPDEGSPTAMAKQILYDDDARRKMRDGVIALAKAVKVTFGPGGHTVIMKKSYGGPTITKDGVTVAKEVELEDPFENMGAKLVIEVAKKTGDAAGDGTTTATILAESIFTEGLRYLNSGVNPTVLKRGLDKCVDAVVAELKAMAKKVKGRDEIQQVATIAANGDVQIGEILATAMDRVGQDGVITVEESKSI